MRTPIHFFLNTALLGLSASVSSALAQATNPFERIVGPVEAVAEMVSIATGYRQSVQTAPAVVSVITAQQIRDYGARDLIDILEFIPGFFVGRTAHSVEPIIAVRGFSSPYNQTLLVMLDGLPQTEYVFGDRLALLGNVPLDIIERVEIMRGPGSALYGADAYSAVVNIITRHTPPEQTQITVRSGSQQTRDARWFGGGRAGDFNLVGALEYQKTDGDQPFITADLQTALDAFFGTRASQAPGLANTHQDRLGIHVNATGEHLSFMLRTALVRDQGMQVGLAGALDPFGHIDSRTVEGKVEGAVNGSDWRAKGALSGAFFQYRLNDVHYFPPGAFGLFPQGVMADTEFEEHRFRLQGTLDYTGLPRHRLTLGAGVESGQTELQSERRNYRLSDGLILPLGPLQDTRDDPSLAALDYSHDLQFIYVQDEWRIHPNWTLTGGVRYDHYADFGPVISPRLALVWDTSVYLTTKLLYGRGFRGPSLLDTEARHIPGLSGNPDLQPEMLDSLELVFDYRPRSDGWVRLNLFYQQTEDQIRVQISDPVGFRPENVGQQKGHGAELEIGWNLDPYTQLYAAYAYQHNTDETTGQDAGYTPHHQAWARLQHRQWPWFFSVQARYIGPRDRIAEDVRPEADPYTLVDALVRREIVPGLEAALDVRNVFDVAAQEAGFGTAFPGDIPLPGRTFLFSLIARF